MGFGTAPVMGELLGYARVSTGEQDTALQVDALRKAGCYKVFTDTDSGARWWCGAWIGWAVRSGTSSLRCRSSRTRGWALGH